MTLRARIAWAHDWMSDPALAAVFQTLPGANFIVNGATPAKNSALASAGTELRLANGAFVAGLDARRSPRAGSARSTKSELYRTLAALRALGGSSSCADISQKASELGMPVRKYNTNRALKSIPEFAERIKRSGHLLSYRITGRGQHLLELLERISARAEAPE